MRCFGLPLALTMALLGCTTSNPDYCGSPSCAVAPDGGTKPVPDLSGTPARTDLASPPAADLATPPPPSCAASADCISGVCLPDATCAPAADVIYVDNRSGTCFGAHKGTQADPVCNIQDGVTLAASTTHHRVFVAASIAAYERFQVSGGPMSIYGPGGSLGAGKTAQVTVRFAGNAGVQVLGGAVVLLDGLEIGPTLDDAVYCQGGTGGALSSLSIARARLHDARDNGLYATRCKVSVDRTTIESNGKAGIEVDSGSQLQVLNSFLYQNAQVGLRAVEGNTARVRFSTLVSNGRSSGGAGAMDCGASNGGGARQIEASLLYVNARNGNGSLLTAACQLNQSAIDLDSWSNGANNIFAARPTLLTGTARLLRTSGSQECCIDKLAAGTGISDVTIDLDGTSRPQGARWDIGASEVK